MRRPTPPTASSASLSRTPTFSTLPASTLSPDPSTDLSNHRQRSCLVRPPCPSVVLSPRHSRVYWEYCIKANHHPKVPIVFRIQRLRRRCIALDEKPMHQHPSQYHTPGGLSFSTSNRRTQNRLYIPSHQNNCVVEAVVSLSNVWMRGIASCYER